MNKLVIGSANFGMKYGFKNSRGKLNPSLVGEILDYAWINNINTIDTAKGYGESESVIGDYLKTNEEKQFRIITKINTTESPTRHLYQSLANLNQSDVYGVLIHNFDYFEKDHSTVVYSIKQINDLVEYDFEIKKHHNNIMKRIMELYK